VTQAITVDYDLPYAPERVWAALTDSELLASWLMPNSFKPSVGHHFRFQAQPLPGWDGVVRCEVLACEPYTRLQYSWKGGSEQIGMLDTVVTWTLTPTAGGTLLQLEQSGFGPQNLFAYENMGNGWRGKLAESLRNELAKMATLNQP
jgi:uncharacterized protein YndB with AHSA1/START domain